MNFTAVVEHCKETGLYVGHVPGFTGAHSQGKTLDELNKNMQEVIACCSKTVCLNWKLNLLARNKSL